MVRAIQEPIFILFMMGGIYAQHTLFAMSMQQILGSIMVLYLLSQAIGDVRGAMQRVMVDSSSFWSHDPADRRRPKREAEPMHGGSQPHMDRASAWTMSPSATATSRS